MIYLDSSAIVKLVSREPETEALLRHLATDREHCSSALASVEVLRAVLRLENSQALEERAGQVLARIAMIRIDRPVLRHAAELAPDELRSLDAIHLATVLSISEPLPVMVTYDQCLSGACALAGVPVVSPA